MSDTLIREQVADLENGTSIWKVHLDALREQDRNARVMAPDKFERLTANIRKHGRLESLPLCVHTVTPGGKDELLIVSGHHRVRAARSAGVMVIFVLVIDEELSKGQVRSKQLAHNQLAGTDNRQILAELYREMENIHDRIESGVTDAELDGMTKELSVDEVLVKLDFEVVNIVFLPEQRKDYDEVIAILSSSAHSTDVAPLQGFATFKAALNAVQKTENVRNIAAALHRMCEIVLEHVRRTDAEEGDNPAQ